MSPLPPPPQPPLFGLFHELLANGVALGVRDYLDGLRALQLGFGGGGRRELRDLALALWARSDDERRLISRWFADVPVAGQPLLDAVEEALRAAAAPAAERAGETRRTDAAPAGGQGSGAQPSASGDDAAATPAAVRARVSFAGARAGGGLPVPRLAAEPPIGEDYVLQPQTPLSLRELVVLWRRYRRSTRRGPRRELDLAATIGERCRRGLLSRPVYRARRGNSARLLVLADASPSMDPWRPFLATLAESLRFGRLASAELRYFNNLPRRQLSADADHCHPQPLDDVLRRHAGGGLLVVSDAGSARGYLNRRRALQTATFLAAARRFFPAIAWLNPMPRGRWAGTTAALVAAGPDVVMLPLDATHLLRAVDILRGNK
jgi:uncharacterized protein with von Willebrand factor type A (vWA) domain